MRLKYNVSSTPFCTTSDGYVIPTSYSNDRTKFENTVTNRLTLSNSQIENNIGIVHHFSFWY